jgi:hypothetical protein
MCRCTGRRPEMPLKLGFAGGTFRCGRCRRRYSNPFSHVCAGRGKGPSKLAPKLSVSTKCPSCGKSYANALTHVCGIKSDFKKRSAADTKAKKAALVKAKPQHRYSACRDGDCRRIGCEAFRVGYDDGFADGMSAASQES